MGPKRKANLILEVNTNSGVSGNVDIVLKTWRNQFENLYNANSNTKSYNCSLTNDIQLFLSYLERNDYYISENDTALLNKPISEAEVIFSIVNAKRNKAVGIDNLPYEVFKNGLSHKLVLNLLTVCFDSGNIPSIWCKSIMKPIPKGKNTNPREPTTYRGISLLCTLGKLYSSLLNVRLCTYLEQNNSLHDGQMAFVKIEHVLITCLC